VSQPIQSVQSAQPRKTEWITHLLAVFVLWKWWDYRSMYLLCWVLGFCLVDYLLLGFAERAMRQEGKEQVGGEWMALSMVVKTAAVGIAISTFFWHPDPGPSW